MKVNEAMYHYRLNSIFNKLITLTSTLLLKYC